MYWESVDQFISILEFREAVTYKLWEAQDLSVEADPEAEVV